MRIFKTLISVLCTLTAALFSSTCGGSLPPTDSGIPVDTNIVPLSLLYLEEATFPDTIYEGEPFDVELKFSADATPDLLGDGLKERCYPFVMPLISDPPADATGGIVYSFWFDSKKEVEGAGDSFSYQFEGLPSGTWAIHIKTTDTPDLAGLLWQIDLYNGGGSIRFPGMSVREYRIEVVPRE
jgi:hypothetical protein